MNCISFKAGQAIQTLCQLIILHASTHNQYTNMDVGQHSLLCVCVCVREGKCVCACVCVHAHVCERKREKERERKLNQRRTTEEEEKRGRAICFVRACLWEEWNSLCVYYQDQHQEECVCVWHVCVCAFYTNCTAPTKQNVAQKE